MQLHTPGPPARLNKEQVEQILKALLKGPQAHGFPAPLWILQRITEFIVAETGVHYLRYTSDPDIVRNTTIHVPKGVRVESVLLSPDAQHLAWIWRRGSGFPVKRLEVWISRVDGEDMHSLGFIDCRSTNQSWTDLIMSFSWIPDGKRLSFCFKGGLYAVPAE